MNEHRDMEHRENGPMKDRVSVFDIPVDKVTFQEAVDRIDAMVSGSPRPEGHHVITANPELIMKAIESDGKQAGDALTLRRIFAEASLVVADGIGLVWASRLLGIPLPERVAGVDLAEALLRRAALRGWRVFIVGGQPGVAELAARRLMERHAGLVVTGTHHGYFSEEESDMVAKQVAAADVDIVLVGMGAPKQERWIATQRGMLGARVMIGVGGALDVFAGRVRRAPIFWQKVGLEWAYRLISEPRRWRRAAALPRFALRVVGHRWKKSPPIARRKHP